MIANDRRANCSHTFRSAEMSNVLARCARGKIKANSMADIEEEILLQANLFLLLVTKALNIPCLFKYKYAKLHQTRITKVNF